MILILAFGTFLTLDALLFGLLSPFRLECATAAKPVLLSTRSRKFAP